MQNQTFAPIPPMGEPTPADLAFQASLHGPRDFEAMIAALAAGADPNRPILDKWRAGEARAPYYHVCEETRPNRDADLGASRALHARAMQAMADAGADFSRPLFYGTNMQAYDRAGQMWQCPGIGVESLAIYHRHGGDMGTLFSEKSFCGLFGRGGRANDPELIRALWSDCGLRERVEAQGMRTTLLTRLIGRGYEEGARALAALGARPAPLIEGSAVADEATGYTSLHILALDSAFYCPPAGETEGSSGGLRGSMTVEKLLRLADLAVELGEDPNALAANGGSALHLALRKRGKHNPGAVLALCKKMGELGATNIPSGKATPLCVHACHDAANARAQLLFAQSLGDDLAKHGRAAAGELLRSTHCARDKSSASILALLIKSGADLAESATGFHPIGSSLAAEAARGLPLCLEVLAKHGPVADWRCPNTGATLASIACSEETLASAPHRKTLALAIELGAPLDHLHDGKTALHLAAANLDHAKCAMLLAAGANPNLLSKEKKTALHYIAAKHGNRNRSTQLKALAAFAAAPATDWAIATPKGETAFSILARKGFLESILAVAARDPDALGAHPAGLAASKALAERGGGLLAAVEELTLGLATAAPAPKTSKAAKRI